MKAGQKIIVRQIRSGAGRDKRTKATLGALGLGKIGSEKEHTAGGALLGMLRKVEHLIEVSPLK